MIYAARNERAALLAEMARREAIRPRLFDSDWLAEVTPAFTWTWPHLKLILREIRKVIARENDRLILSVPPRHGKSEAVTVRLPVYLMENDPSHRVIVGAYSQFLANKFSRKTRKIALARGIIPMSRSRYAVEEWETENEGGMRAAGVGAGVTGTGGDTIIVDDPVKSRKEANSEVTREAVWDWYKDDLFTRMEPGSAMIVIMTRWHEDDLAGRLIKEEGRQEDGGQWRVINLPALAEENDPLGRKPGEALCPERYDEEALARIQKVLKSSFPALYQGRPVPLGGNIILREWFHYYNTPPSNFFEIVQSWDTAYKPNQINDPSVCTTWLVGPYGFYLLDEFRDHLEFPALKRTALALFRNAKEKWGVSPSAVLIEDKASGQSLIQELRNTSGGPPVIAIEPENDKITRAEATTPLYEAGLVHHPANAPWLPDYESELCSFPVAPNDDRVDSMSQFLIWAMHRRQRLEAYGTGRRSMFAPEVMGDRSIQTVLQQINGTNRFRGF